MVPLMFFIVVFFVIPAGLIFATSLNPQAIGQVAVTWDPTFNHFIRVFSRSNDLEVAGRSVLLGVAVAFVTLVVACPMAFVIAKTESPGRNTFLLILVLAAMRLALLQHVSETAPEASMAMVLT